MGKDKLKIRPFNPNTIVTDKGNPYGLPRALRKYIHKTYGYKELDTFRKWWASIKTSQDEAIDVLKAWNREVDIGGDENLWTARKPRGKYSGEKSHIQAKNIGGSGYTFLEYWKYNAARANTEDKKEIPFINPELMKEAGLPSTWYELFTAWKQQQAGNITSLGPLEQINPDDIIALHRGDQVNKVHERREWLDTTYDRVLENPSYMNEIVQDRDGNEITIEELYNRRFSQSRGLDPNDNIGEVWLKRHTGWDLALDAKGKYKWVRVPEKYLERDYKRREQERFSHPGEINYGPLDDIQPESEITGASSLDPSEMDPEAINAYQQGEIGHPSEMRHNWLQNPFSNVPKPQFDEVWQKEQTPINQIKGAAIQGLIETIPQTKAVKNLTRPLIEPISNALGDLTDKTLGKEIRNQDKLINKAYQERVSPERLKEIIQEAFPYD